MNIEGSLFPFSIIIFTIIFSFLSNKETKLKEAKIRRYFQQQTTNTTMSIIKKIENFFLFNPKKRIEEQQLSSIVDEMV